MKKQRKNKPGAIPASAQSALLPTSAKARRPLSRHRLWLFRLTAAVALPLVLVAGLELGLRLAGQHVPTSFLLPANVGGEEVLVQNNRVGWRYFTPLLARQPHPLTISPAKPPKTIRIFIFGESAAYGDPDPDFGLPRMLEVLLGGRYPELRFEVINAAMTAINSHAIVDIARDCARADGDIWVVYMGNNEVVGPYGAGTIFGAQAPSRRLVRASLALKSTAIGQLLEQLAASVARADPSDGQWGGLEMFLQNQVRQSDPAMQTVYRSFAENLAEILALGREAGAKIVLSTVSSNLKDCAPFASLHRPSLSTDQLAAWTEQFDLGKAAQQANQPAKAIEHHVQAAEIDDTFAELQFRWAECCLAAGKVDEAGRRFTMARDADTLRFRADFRLNELIRQAGEAASSDEVALVDAELALNDASPQGVTGDDLFHEHVHFNFPGNYRLGRLLAEAIVRLLPESATAGIAMERPWLTEEDCARRLAWTSRFSYEAKVGMLTRLSRPPFSTQYRARERHEHLVKEIEQLMPSLVPPGVNQDIAACRQALSSAPDDWVLKRILAALLAATGDLGGADELYRQVAQTVPSWPAVWQSLGNLALQRGEDSEAIAAVEQAVKLDPYAEASRLELGGLYLRQGNAAKATECLEQVLAQRPNSRAAHWAMAILLESTGQPEEAQAYFQRARDLRAISPEELRSQGRRCFEKGWLKESASSYEAALKINPTDVESLLGLAKSLNALGCFDEMQVRCDRAIELDPTLGDAHLLLGVALGQQGHNAESAKCFREAIRLEPGLISARLNLGLIMLKEGNRSAARDEFEEVLRQEPGNAMARQNLQALKTQMPR